MKIVIHQICYSEETLKEIPEGFLVLDNLKNERPDWREYWPIRNFLLSNDLQEGNLYGFFSPKFLQKTNLDSEKINSFVTSNYQNQTLINFSPFWDLSSIFQNIFEQGDFFHPGLRNACQLFSKKFLSNFDLENSITHSQNTIFCNYFVAKREFWYKWLKLGELLFNSAEENNSELALELNKQTSYGAQNLPMKIFVQERLASICMLTDQEFSSIAFNPFEIGASTTPFNRFFHEAVLSDALKFCYANTHARIYLREFASIRNEILKKLKLEQGR